MRLEATSPFEGKDDLRQQSHHPPDSPKCQGVGLFPKGVSAEKENRLSDYYGDQAPRQVTPDKNNAASGWQLPQRQMQNSGQRQDACQSQYYSDDSEFDSVSVTLVSTSKVSTAREG